jgi:sugar O-acyltransferase (sialic acid O-acetyltransferase NeuD family)
MKLIGCYGAAGCGRGIMPLLQAEYSGGSTKLVFVDDGLACETVNGHNVLSWDGFCASAKSEKSICIAIANSSIRERLAEQCKAAGIPIVGARASNCVIMDKVEIGEGALISPFVTLTSNIQIGRFFHANLYSYVEHDCVIGDFVTFAPGVKCNGNVHIHDHAYIGAGAILRQGKPGQPLVIGRGAIIGMGAIVTKNVAEGETVIGNPARIYSKAL